MHANRQYPGTAVASWIFEKLDFFPPTSNIIKEWQFIVFTPLITHLL